MRQRACPAFRPPMILSALSRQGAALCRVTLGAPLRTTTDALLRGPISSASHLPWISTRQTLHSLCTKQQLPVTPVFVRFQSSLALSARAVTSGLATSASSLASHCGNGVVVRRIVPNSLCSMPSVGRGGGHVRRFRVRRQGYEYFDNEEPFSIVDFLRRRWLFIAFPGVGFGYYYVSHLEPVPISGRRRFMNVTAAEELRMGEVAYKDILAKYAGRILPQSHPLTKMVRSIGERIVAVSELKGLNWEFIVVDAPDINCFVLPGGKVFVFTGILPILQTPDGMAAVLGHEIAHQVARHSAEKLSFAKILVVLQLLFAMVIDTSSLVRTILFRFGLEMPFSRKCETEADYIGLLLMGKACFEPAEAIDVWKRMAVAQANNAPPEYLSTHPSSERRMENIEKWLPEAQRERNQHCDMGEPLRSFLRW